MVVKGLYRGRMVSGIGSRLRSRLIPPKIIATLSILMVLTSCSSSKTSACSIWQYHFQEPEKVIPYFEKLVDEEPLLNYILEDLYTWKENVEKKKTGELTKWEEVTYWYPFYEVETFCGVSNDES